MSSPSQGDGPEKKVTRLAIGVEGGFDPQSSQKKYEFEDFFNITVLPGYTSLAWPDSNLPEIVSARMSFSKLKIRF